MKHIVLFSGGLSSAILLDRINKIHRKNTIALFTDTLWEDEDNYRFINQVVNYLQVNFVNVNTGKIPPDIWFKERYLVGKNAAKCSLFLKTKQTLKFIKKINEPCTLYFGIDKKEAHRAVNISYRYAPVECSFPLIEEPLSHKEMVFISERIWKIKIPRMYGLGFSHANCGGRCPKGGHKHFLNLLKVWPDRFDELSFYEQKFRREINKISILKDRKMGQVKYITLEDFRENQNIVCDYEVPCECVS